MFSLVATLILFPICVFCWRTLWMIPGQASTEAMAAEAKARARASGIPPRFPDRALAEGHRRFVQEQRRGAS